mgnify:CR=1 FL=1
MKVGDLVTVCPARVGLYLIIEDALITCTRDPWSKVWILWGKDVPCIPMSECWIEAISKAP